MHAVNMREDLLDELERQERERERGRQKKAMAVFNNKY